MYKHKSQIPNYKDSQKMKLDFFNFCTYSNFIVEIQRNKEQGSSLPANEVGNGRGEEKERDRST